MKYIPLYNLEIHTLKNEWIDMSFVKGSNNKVYLMAPKPVKNLGITKNKKKSMWAQDCYDTAISNLAGDKKKIRLSGF